jgi:hypothetical protein
MLTMFLPRPVSIPLAFESVLRTSADRATLRRAASTTSVRRLDLYARSSHVPTALGVLLNPNATAKHLDAVARLDHPAVREACATHPMCGKKTLKRLAGDPYPTVRLALAGRMNLPRAARETLAADPARTIREQLTIGSGAVPSDFLMR